MDARVKPAHDAERAERSFRKCDARRKIGRA
jgi:hypothetical protein